MKIVVVVILILGCMLTPVYSQIEEVDIVIVGAGIAGIKAARDAVDNGFSVVILEAQNRYGGRIKTVRREGYNSNEEGAMWYHSSNYNSMIDEADECAINLQLYDQSDYKLWEDGSRLNNQDLRQLSANYGQAWTNAAPYEQLFRSDQSTFLLGGYVPTRRVETARRFVDEQVYGSNAEKHDSTGWQDLPNAGVDQFAPDGYDLVLDCMLDKSPSIRGALRLNSAVKTIKYEIGNGKAQVVYLDPAQSNNANDCIDSEGGMCKKINARVDVIVTVSVGVMKRREIKFIPNLSQAHWDSVDRKLFGPVTKLTAYFNQEGAAILRRSKYASNYLIRICGGSNPRFELKPYIFINHQFLTGSAMLTSYDQGYVASNFSQLTPSQLKTIFMGAAREFAPDLPEPSYFDVQHWGIEPYVWGGYSDRGLGCTEADYKLWESPIGSSGNLWFAGEGYTSGNIWGTVSASYNSSAYVISQIVNKK